MALTKSDLQELEKLFDRKLSDLSSSFDHKLGDLEDRLTEKISHLPDKEEFFMAMDKWMKATSTADIERPLHRREHEEIRKFLKLNQA